MEFDLIRRWFAQPFESLRLQAQNQVLRGIGDDCARLALPSNSVLCVSTDSLESGIHFFDDVSPADLGWKALAVNLSDLAASGAQPIGFTLNLTLFEANSAWLSDFSQGLLDVATRFECPLVGGDTTSRQSGLGVAVTVFGQKPLSGSQLDRSDAQIEDDVWVSGCPGLARLGLLLEFHARQLPLGLTDEAQAEFLVCLSVLPDSVRRAAKMALLRPIPRLCLGRALRDVANACMDLSDGLAGDVAHIAQASAVSIELDAQALDHLWLRIWPQAGALLPWLRQLSLVGGDDYELCFTVPHAQQSAMVQIASELNMPLFKVGQVKAGQGVYLNLHHDRVIPVSNSSFVHFS